MKKKSFLFSVIALFIFVLSAGAETWNGFEYEFRDGGAVILGYSGSDVNLSIPLAFDNISVTEIADSAFENNVDIVQVSMPSTIVRIGKRAFSGCSRLTAVNISSGLKSIGERAFAWCTGLTYFTLPADLEVIEQYAFDNCENIVYFQDLTGNSLHWVGKNAFDDTAWYKNVYGDNITINQGRVLLKYSGNATSYTIPWNIFYIAEDAFAGNDETESLILPNNIMALQSGSISHMASLRSIYSSTEIDNIEESAFLDLPELETVSIHNDDLDFVNFMDCPKSPYGSLSSRAYSASIPDEADKLFVSDYDKDLDAVVILHCLPGTELTGGVLEIPSVIRGKRVAAIGEGACQDRSDITKVILPAYLREIRSWAFSYDTQLSEVVFPETLERIEDDAFTNCALDTNNLDLPENVDAAERAFYQTAK